MYPQLFGELRRFCLALGVGHASEDVAQEALIYGRAHLGDLRDDSKLRPWLRVIASRAASRERRRQRLTTELDVSQMVDAVAGLEPDLKDAIGRLPHRQRQLVLLVYGLGYPEEEVARLVGIRRGTVAATLWQARKRLARALMA